MYIALKIEDGAQRAAQLAMISLLERLNCFSSTQRASLEQFLEPPQLTIAGLKAGYLRTTAAFDNLKAIV